MNKIEEGLYYHCCENKGSDQLCSYCTADLHLFSHRQKSGFLMMRQLLKQILFPIASIYSGLFSLLDTKIRNLQENCGSLILNEQPRGKTNNVVCEKV